MSALRLLAWSLAILTGVLVAAAITALLLSIWVGDDRWLATASVLLFAPIVTGASAGFLFVGVDQ